MTTDSANAPRVNYTGQSQSQVNADYADMPAGVTIRLVDKTSGAALDSGAALLQAGGSGSTSVAIEASTPAGDYYLGAYDGAGAEIAQSVDFYIAT
jgi:hypothetical protein